MNTITTAAPSRTTRNAIVAIFAALALVFSSFAGAVSPANAATNTLTYTIGNGGGTPPPSQTIVADEPELLAGSKERQQMQLRIRGHSTLITELPTRTSE